MHDQDHEEVTTLSLTVRWFRRVISWVVSLGLFGVFLVLLVALGLYQFGYRPDATESEEVRLAPWGGAEADRPDRPQLRILSLNLNYGAGAEPLKLEAGERWELDTDEVTARLDTLARTIKERDVDMVLLQQVDFGSEFAGKLDQAEYLARRLKYGYLAKADSWKHPYSPFPDPLADQMLGPVESGLAVISRVPVLATTRFSLPGATFGNWWQSTFAPTYCLQMVQVSVRDQELRLFQTHLTAGRTIDRERQARHVAALIGRESLGKSVLMGTLGAPPPDIRVAPKSLASDNTVPLVRHRMNFQALVEDFDLIDDPSWATATVDGKPAVVDYVLPEKGLHVEAYELLEPGDDVSPHKALVFDLIL